MSKGITPRMRRAIELHVLNGVPANLIKLRHEEQERLEIITEVVGLFNKNRLTPINDILEGAYRRRGINRTYYTRSVDMLCINHILSYFTAASRNINLLQVDEAANKLIQMGAQSGNPKALQGGAELKAKIHRLYDEEQEEKVDRTPISFVLTENPREAGIDRDKLTEEEREAIMRRYGVTQKRIETIRQESEDIIDDLGYTDFEEINDDPIERLQPEIENDDTLL